MFSVIRSVSGGELSRTGERDGEDCEGYGEAAEEAVLVLCRSVRQSSSDLASSISAKTKMPDPRNPARMGHLSSQGKLQQLYGSHFDGVALHIASDISANMVLLVGSLQLCENLRIAVRVKLQELLIWSNNSEAALLAHQRTIARMRIRVRGHLLRAGHVDDRNIIEGLCCRQRRGCHQTRHQQRSYYFHHYSPFIMTRLNYWV